jgi:sulfite reductase alpha subunit-like flavoprotein
VHPQQIHACVGLVRDKTPLGFYTGVCSGWLASLPGGGPSVVPLYVRQSVFRLPVDPRVPVVMVAGGVGIAPFRAFLQELGARRSESGTSLNEQQRDNVTDG